MSMKPFTAPAWIAGPMSVALLLAAVAGRADEATETPAAEDTQDQPLEALDVKDLQDMRGADAAVENLAAAQTVQNTNASVSDSNVNANSVTTGGVTFDQNSINNFAGIGLFNSVTGNNNAIDTVVGITINLQQ